jgi:hypothetical protein
MDTDWAGYHAAIEGRPPRALLLRALAARDGIHGQAIDAGFGDCTESEALVEGGWHVLSIDPEPAAAERLRERIDEAQVATGSVRVARQGPIRAEALARIRAHGAAAT